MADRNETIADIRKDAEAKFRELVEAYMQRRSTFQTTVGAMQAFNNVFDRIEAAHKRERGVAVTGSNQLRDALRLCMGAMCKYCVADAEARGLPTECVHGCEALLKAKAALAAPPRNCDVYTADELKVIFKRELASELPIANEHEKNLITITAMRMIDTLFSPATEKEGGNDGNK